MLKRFLIQAHFTLNNLAERVQVYIGVKKLIKSGIYASPLVFKDGTVIHLKHNYPNYYVLYENLGKNLYEKYFPTSFAPKVILDLGANKGFFSVAMAKRFPTAQIYAVEPESENYEYLVRNTKPFPNVHTIQAAVWKERGEIGLNMNPKNSGSHSLVFKGSERPVQRVTTITLADLPKADLIKCDIEGAEFELSFDAPYLVMEAHITPNNNPTTMVHKLLEDGYRVIVMETPIIYAWR